MADQPYSASTILGDLLRDQRTLAILDEQVPDMVSNFARNFGGGLPPGFENIITPEWLLRMSSDGADRMVTLNTALADVPLTTEVTELRCARYDQVPPVLPAEIPHPAILVFDKITGFRDPPAVDAAKAALIAMAERRGWALVFSDNGAVFNKQDLARFDAVVWNNISGDVLTMPQRAAFIDFLTAGGGFAGIHSAAGDPVYIWDWYIDTLIGARFMGVPAAPRFQEARVLIENPASGITRGLPLEWMMTDEWYSFSSSPGENGAHVLAKLDEESYGLIGFGGRDIAMGDHPIAWSRCIGNGRSFYTAIGHRPESYVEPNSLKLLEQGIAWAAGLGETRCLGGVESIMPLTGHDRPVRERQQQRSYAK